jgi:hypothetical protein
MSVLAANPGKRHLVPALILLYALLCFGASMALSFQTAGGARFAHQAYVPLFMGATVLTLFVVPLIAANQGNAWRPRNDSLRMAPPGGLLRVIAGRMASPAILASLLCLGPAAGALAARLLLGGVPAWDIVRAFIVLLGIAVFALALGLYCSILCYDVFSAAGLALLVMLMLCTGPIWTGPAIEATANASLLIQSALSVNPLVGIASALNYDIFRAEPWYQICPVGQRRFDYPSWYSTVSLNGLISIFLLWRAAAGIRKLTIAST